MQSFREASAAMERLSHLVAALCSEVWQNRNRTSLRAFVNAYLPDISSIDLSAVKPGNMAVQLGRGFEVTFRDAMGFGVEVEVDMRLLHKVMQHKLCIVLKGARTLHNYDSVYLRYRQCGFLSLAPGLRNWGLPSSAPGNIWTTFESQRSPPIQRTSPLSPQFSIAPRRYRSPRIASHH
jgi:hypothetical protein